MCNLSKQAIGQAKQHRASNTAQASGHHGHDVLEQLSGAKNIMQGGAAGWGGPPVGVGWANMKLCLPKSELGSLPPPPRNLHAKRLQHPSHRYVRLGDADGDASYAGVLPKHLACYALCHCLDQLLRGALHYLPDVPAGQPIYTAQHKHHRPAQASQGRRS